MQFHYFALRKMHFLLHARAVAVFPGGFGTFDESFELLTLIQTGKIDPIPVLFYGKDFWHRVVNFEALVEEGVIGPRDLEPVPLRRDGGRGWQIVQDFWKGKDHTKIVRPRARIGDGA
jgi:predicted Rossmann-fold nucleotide-binding protein